MNNSKLLLAYIFFSLISATSYSQHVLGYADSIRIHYQIPEISYAVLNSKKILEMNASGKHSVNLTDTATLNDRFHIGSNTKAMTTFIIAKFVESGKLSWSTKFFDLFPEWKKESKPEYANITLKDLLSHRAGIHTLQGDSTDPVVPSFDGTKVEKRKAFGRFVLKIDPLKTDSLQPFIYSNAGYTLATLMLEKVAKKSWEELVIKVFNADLKLDVAFSWPENQKRKDTWGHSFEKGTLIPVPSSTDFRLDYTEPAGDLNMKMKDFAKFIQLHLDGLQGNNNYLKASTYSFMHKGLENYAMGWYNIKENGNEYSTHSGTVGTYYTTVQIDRKKGIGYIIFTNSFNNDTQQGVRLLMRRLKEEFK